jgi:hypothetical protein
MTVIINTQEEFEALIDDANDIDAWSIKADNINANDIKADYINAWNIDANDINYFAFCIAHQSLKCKTIEGSRENSLHACLDQPIEYIK